MRIEKIILSIGGVVAGLFVAGIAFYIYQTTQTISPGSIKTITLNKPTAAPSQAVPLAIDSPVNNSVSMSRTITVSGRTDSQATIVITTDTTDTVVSPSSQGAFSTTITEAVGENRLIITAIKSDGTQSQQQLTVSVETDNF